MRVQTVADTSAEPSNPATGRPRLSPTATFGLAATILALFLMASTIPSPMYAIYQREWGFSSTVLTVVFAVYMLGTMAALLLAGSLSDHLGRRPALLGALTLEIVSLLVMAVSPNVGWLILGRVLQGLATGTVTSAVSGTLLDFQKPGSGRGPLVNGVGAASGMAAGSALAGALVQFAPAPTKLSYFVLVLALAVALVGVVLMPESVRTRPGQTGRAFRPQRPVVPAGHGRVFALLSVTMLASWTVGGMFMSLGPSVASTLIDGDSKFIGGLTVTVLAGFGSIAQVIHASTTGRRAVRTGAPLLVVGLAGVAAAVVGESAVVLFAGSVVLGFGWGLVFMGGFRLLSSLARPHQRAGTSATIYLVAYLSASTTSILLGYLTTLFGLATATIVFASAAAAFSVLAWLSTLAVRES